MEGPSILTPNLVGIVMQFASIQSVYKQFVFIQSVTIQFVCTESVCLQSVSMQSVSIHIQICICESVSIQTV